MRKDREEVRREVEFELFMQREDEKVARASAPERPPQRAASSSAQVGDQPAPPVPASDAEFDRFMREHDGADEEDEGLKAAYDDDRERSDSYLAEEPPAKRPRGDSNNDDDEDDARLLSFVARL